jgi:phosphoribosylaminoimidazole-succinocarboxamide synthase
MVGGAVAEQLRDLSLKIYSAGFSYALKKRIILADTKLEFGWIMGRLNLVDELLTPDSSRWWDLDTWKPGISPPSLDKQPLRDYLEAIGWDKDSPPPDLPESVVNETSERYREIHTRLTGLTWPPQF